MGKITRYNQYTISEQARNLYLEYDNRFMYATDAVIRRCYNGVGNEALPNEVRAVLTKLTSFFGDLPFMIHDFDYQYLEKTKYNFHASNRRLRNNLLIILNDKLPPCKIKPKWYEAWHWDKWLHRKKRVFYLTQIRIIFFAVEEFGWRAFKDAGNE